MRPIRRRRRTSRYRAYAALTRSPCSSSVARAASSAFAGQPRSRETSAISASATTHRARATASLGPKARAARRRRAFARTRSPSCAIAMPRSARAGGSSRKATRFSAPRGSPAARARAAAVISDPIQLPPHLSLPPFRCPVLIYFTTTMEHTQQVSQRRSTMQTSPESGRKGRSAMNTPPIVSPQEWAAAREQLLVKEKALTRAREALAAERRRMPWVAVEKAYEFDGPKGKASLLGLFEGRRQLIVYRAFFEPGVFGWPEHACRGCSMVADQVAHVAHLNARDTTLAFVSRAPQT